MYVVFFFVDGTYMSLATSVLVGPSQILKFYLLLIPGLACLALLYAGVVLYGEFGFYILLMLAVSLLLVMWLVRRQFSDLNSYRLEIDREGGMILRDIHSVLQEEIAHLMYVNSPIVVWTYLILLHIHDEFGRQRYLLIFRDAVSEDAFRQLRVIVICMAQRRQHALLDKNQKVEGNF